MLQFECHVHQISKKQDIYVYISILQVSKVMNFRLKTNTVNNKEMVMIINKCSLAHALR